MKSKILVGSTITICIILTLSMFSVNIISAKKIHALKLNLENLSKRLREKPDYIIKEPYYTIRIKDSGKIMSFKKQNNLINANFLTDNSDYTTAMFKKMKGRATSGGGFVHFKWVWDDILRDDIGYAHRDENPKEWNEKGSHTLIVCHPEI